VVSAAAIKAEGLSKEYRLGAARAPYGSIRETLSDLARLPLRAFARSGASEAPARTVWALRDVSFEIAPGDAVGIIGRNGAGKSTLLKVLSRITEPTRGRVEIRGRVVSLLEVGTGFHGELTGRENVFLNGAILGMTRRETRARFDEIVGFAEMEKFIDTPVKHYSSGMHMRLAFSVAAHLRSDILLVDEVLAVGDIAFQRKCLSVMGEVARSGRTLLFVSHNMALVGRTCSRAILLSEGAVAARGDIQAVVNQYLAAHESQEGERRFPPDDGKAVHIASVRLTTEGREPASTFDLGGPIAVALDYEVREVVPSGLVGVRIATLEGVPVFTSCHLDTVDRSGPPLALQPGRFVGRVVIPARLLAPGSYTLTVAVIDEQMRVIDIHEDTLIFEVVDMGGGRWRERDTRRGVINLDLPWEIERAP
jgi:lipopolysaccharide transport system ATP-binding protein